MTNVPHIASDRWAHAQRMLDAKAPISRIAAWLNVDDDTVRRRLLPGYRQARAEQIRAARARRRGEDIRVLPWHSQADYIDPIDAERALRSVPADTRSPAARLLGDPLPGRSAYDRRQGAQP